MRNWINRTPLFGRIAVAMLLVSGVTIAMSVPVAQAVPTPTHLVISGIAPVVTIDKTNDAFAVDAQDAAAANDQDYAGTVTFSAGCGDCFAVTPNNGAGHTKEFTFNNGTDGHMNFTIQWKSTPASSLGAQTLTAAAAGLTSGTANTTVASNAATKIDLQNVDTSTTVGAQDPFTVAMKNAADETGADYTGTITFSASCGDCFTVTEAPNNMYTFVAGDNGTKNFTLIWKEAAQGTGRTFTATGTGGVTPDTVTGIDVGAPVPPTTTTVAPTTTTTTLPPHTAKPMMITGAGPGGGPHVIARAADNGAVLYSFYAYDPNFAGGVRVAAGDVNNDGWDDIITAPGPGGGPHVKVFSGKTGALLNQFMAYSPSFTGGVFVATADVNNDGKFDIITGPDAGGGPHVKIFSGASSLDGTDGNLLGQFMAYATTFHGGVRVAGGDFDGDHHADIVTGAGPGGGPHVRVLHADGSEVPDLPHGGFYAYGAQFTGGVYVAADPADIALIITGAGAGGGRHVRAFDADGTEELGFIASGANEGAIPAIGDTSSDAADIFLLSRAVNDPHVQVLSEDDGHEISSFPAYNAPVPAFVAVGVL